jgi:two-component system, NarL family, response regulator NreC
MHVWMLRNSAFEAAFTLAQFPSFLTYTFHKTAKGTTDMYTEAQERQVISTSHTQEAVKIMLFSQCKLRYLGLYYICSEYKEFMLLGSEDTLSSNSAILAGVQPDLIIVDQALLIGGSLQPGDILRGFRQVARILIIADQIDLAFACAAIVSGIDGYLLTSASQEEMLQTLRTIARGGSWLELRFVKMLVERLMNSAETPAPEPKHLPGARQLSEREQQILQYLAEGYTCKEVAKELYLSESSVRTYWYRIMNKLNAVNKAEAIMIASRAGLLATLTPLREVTGRRG